MTSGGHARSGPAKDPNALRRSRDNFTLRQLPRTPYAGPVPRFPLPPAVVTVERSDGKAKWKEFHPELSHERRQREAAIWEWAWTLPQAHVWAQDSWRLLDIAMWVRTQVACEAVDASAADKNSLHRFACKIGMGPDGLKENGWSIAADMTADKRAEGEKPAVAVSAKDRLQAAQ
jgi:hypothetical protein